MATDHHDPHEHADDIRGEFRRLVNMTPAALERWLATDESKAVGWKGPDGDGEGESVGHAEGARIVAILHKRAGDLDAEDDRHMHKVVGYIKRHMAQKPAHPEGSNWEKSLKNWGHDPAKDPAEGSAKD